MKAEVRIVDIETELLLKQGEGKRLAVKAKVIGLSSAAKEVAVSIAGMSWVLGTLCSDSPVVDSENAVKQREDSCRIEAQIPLSREIGHSFELVFRVTCVDGLSKFVVATISESLRVRAVRGENAANFDRETALSGSLAELAQFRKVKKRILSEVVKRSGLELITCPPNVVPELTVLLIGSDLEGVFTTLSSLRGVDLSTTEVILSLAENIEWETSFSPAVSRFVHSKSLGALSSKSKSRAASETKTAEVWSALWWRGLMPVIRAETVAIISAGTELLPGALETAAKSCSNPEVGGVACRLICPAAGQQPSEIFASPALAVRNVEQLSLHFSVVRRHLLWGALQGALDSKLASQKIGPTQIANYLLQAQRTSNSKWFLRYEPRAVAISDEVVRGNSVFGASFRAKGAAHVPEVNPESKKIFLLVDDPLLALSPDWVFQRQSAIISAAQAQGFRVVLYPTIPVLSRWSELCRALPVDLEVIHEGTVESFADYLVHSQESLQVVWVSKPGLMEAFGPIVAEFCQRDIDRPLVVYDIGGFPSLRELLRQQVSAPRAMDPEYVESVINRDIAPGRFADVVVAETAGEAEECVVRGLDPVFLLGASCSNLPNGQPLASRQGVASFGNAVNDDCPHGDGILWFLEQVVPLLQSKVEAKDLSLTLYGTYGIWLRKWSERYSLTIRADLTDLLERLTRHRVYVAPTRFDSGLPFPVLLAAAAGTPVVCTGVVASQLGWEHKREVYIANNPQEFATGVAELLSSDTLWHQISTFGVQSAEKFLSSSEFSGLFQAILATPVKGGVSGFIRAQQESQHLEA